MSAAIRYSSPRPQNARADPPPLYESTPTLKSKCNSDQVASWLAEVIVLRASDEVQWHVLRINGGDFQAAYNVQVSLLQFGRLFCLCHNHSRVIRCDFIER